jgi:putative inorganic carbon (HCO3(-)) transporter
MPWLLAVVATLAWGAGAFGSPYPWAYIPLLIASTAIGLGGLWIGRRNSGLSIPLMIGLILIALAVSTQLVPLPLSRLEVLSPHAPRILAQHSLEFSLGQSQTHSLSIDASRSQLGLAFFGAFTLLLLGTARILRRETANRLAGALMILGVALATFGIVQRATFNGMIYGFWDISQGGGSPFGPFINKNHFAGWMLMALPVALGYLFALGSRGMRDRKSGFRNIMLWLATADANRAVLTGFAILIMALSLVLTMSRSGIIACAAALLIAGTVTSRRQTGASRRTLTVGYLVFLVIAVVSWVGLDQIVTRFGHMDPSSIHERPAIWADTIRIAKDFWLTGTGLNTYGISTLYYQTAVPGLHLREAHSDYLQLAAEGGLLLAAPIVLTIVAFAFEVRRRFRQDTGSIWWIRLGAVIGLVAIALQSVVEFSLQMPGNAALFAVIAGLAIHDSRR